MSHGIAGMQSVRADVGNLLPAAVLHVPLSKLDIGCNFSEKATWLQKDHYDISYIVRKYYDMGKLHMLFNI